ncbi:YitT family protein [Paenibacillus sp.]|uniref:YitT family protein n=1 Tax=Paenibacillus sp. TaxID=58172 RepID=UPI0028123134|nr:YitT family protein [Paenibacillus sp.]
MTRLAPSVKTVSSVVLGILMTAFGIKLLSASTLTFGGTAGVAFLLSYTTSFSWGFWFVLANAPFFLLSYRMLGARFTLSTLLSVAGTSLAQLPLDGLAVPASGLHPIAAAVASGMCIGIGIAFVLNNGSSLGGVQIFALVLDRKFGFNRGATIFVADAIVVASAALLLGGGQAMASIVSIAIASGIIGRYRRISARLPESALPSTAPRKAEDRAEPAP